LVARRAPAQPAEELRLGVRLHLDALHLVGRQAHDLVGHAGVRREVRVEHHLRLGPRDDDAAHRRPLLRHEQVGARGRARRHEEPQAERARDVDGEGRAAAGHAGILRRVARRRTPVVVASLDEPSGLGTVPSFEEPVVNRFVTAPCPMHRMPTPLHPEHGGFRMRTGHGRGC